MKVVCRIWESIHQNRQSNSWF